MKFKNLLIIGAFTLCAFTLSAQETKDKQMEDAAAKEQAQWTAYMTPGSMQKMLAASNGEWKEEVTMWMAPGAPASKSESSCTNRMILGDRYQESTHKGEMMGMPFEGRSTVAYDNAKKVFQTTWVDNMGTGIMYMEGTYDEKTKTMNLKGKCMDVSSGKEEMAREVFKYIDENNHVLEMYMTKNGKEFKTMEAKFTRKS